MSRKKSQRLSKQGIYNPIDVWVGLRVRQRRVLVGLSQAELGTAMGVTFQQLQKYEQGANRISSSRLFDFSKILAVDVGYFFSDMPNNIEALSPAQIIGREASTKPVWLEPDVSVKRETLELARAYNRIGNAEVRHGLKKTVETIAANFVAAEDAADTAKSRKALARRK